jgi:hypothetical protein
MLDFIAGKRPDEPEAPVEPEPIDGDSFHTREEYAEVWGNAFLGYVCANVEVQLGWSDAEGTDTVSGSLVSDPTMGSVFPEAVLGASGEGKLTPPDLEEENPLKSKLEKLTRMVEGLTVQVPPGPAPGDVFTPAEISFAALSPAELDPEELDPEELDPAPILSGGDDLKYVDQCFVEKEGEQVPDFEETLLNFCSELIESLKSNLKNSISAHHAVAAQATVPGGFTGTLEMVSIS